MPPPQSNNAAQTQPAQAPKYAPPPSVLPLYQRVDPKTVSFFGRTSYDVATDSKKLIFGMKRGDRLRHMYVVGKAGSGKTKMFEMLMRQDIAYGYGTCVIDPHGELIRDMLRFIPAERTRDVVILDAGDAEHPFLWNPFAGIPESLRHRYTQGLLEVFEIQMGSGWGSRIEHLLRVVLLTLLDYPHATLRSVVPLLTDDTFRKEVTGYVRDAGLRQFWAQEFSVWEDRFSSEAILPIVSTMREILSDPTLSAIFGSGENRLNIAEFFEQEKILLVGLARAKLGVKDARFLGSMFLTCLSVIAVHEGSEGRRKRPFYVYADDILESATQSFETLITDARRNQVAVTISQQFAGELPTGLKRFLLGNMATIIAFRTNTDDAAWLESEFAPVFKAKDLLLLPPRIFIAKLTIDGSTQEPFMAETLDVFAPAQAAKLDDLLQASRAAYAQSRQEIEKRIAEADATRTVVEEATKKMEQEIRIPIAPKPTPIPPHADTRKSHSETKKSARVPDEAGDLTRELQDLT